MASPEIGIEQALAEHGVFCWTNVGISMLPLLREGRDIMIVGQKKASPKKYDVILFVKRNPDGSKKYILHRVIKVLPDGVYRTLGDNSLTGETVRESDILGIMTGFIRDGKKHGVGECRYLLYVYTHCAPYRLRIFFRKCVITVRRLKRKVSFF